MSDPAQKSDQRVVLSKRLAAINSISSVIARLLNITVLLWMYQYLLRQLSPEQFGIYPVLMSLMSFAPLFFSFFTGGVSRFVVDAYARRENSRVTEIVSSMVILLFVFGLGFLAIGALLTIELGSVLTIPKGSVESAQMMLSMLLISSTAQMVLLPLSVGFHVRQQFVLLNLLDVLRVMVRIVLLLALLLGVGAKVIWVVTASVVADLLHLGVVVTLSQRMVPEIRIDRSLFRWTTASELISFGAWTTLGRLGSLMYVDAGTIILNKLGSAVDVVNFYLGATIYQQALGTVNVALLPLQPALTAMHATNDYSRLSNTFLRAGRYSLWISLAVACPLTIFSESFVGLYLEETYATAAYVIIMFMVIFPFTQPTALLPMTAIATANVRSFHVAAFLAQLLGLLLMLYFTAVLELGAIGVAFALMLITVGSQLVYFWRLSTKLARISWARFFEEALRPGVLPAFAGTCAWLPLQYFFPPTTWLALITYAAIGGVVYLIAVTGCLNASERSDLRSIVAKIL